MNVCGVCVDVWVDVVCMHVRGRMHVHVCERRGVPVCVCERVRRYECTGKWCIQIT